MVSSIGYSNGYAQGTQFAPQRQTQIPPYALSFAGTPQVEEESPKKSNKGKVALGILAGVAVAGAALYGLFKTGKLTKVENASKWTEKLQNLAYKGGEGIDKGVTKITEWGKGLIDKYKSGKSDTATVTYPEKDRYGQLFIQFPKA